jgi:hypothetical protein
MVDEIAPSAEDIQTNIYEIKDMQPDRKREILNNQSNQPSGEILEDIVVLKGIYESAPDPIVRTKKVSKRIVPLKNNWLNKMEPDLEICGIQISTNTKKATEQNYVEQELIGIPKTTDKKGKVERTNFDPPDNNHITIQINSNPIASTIEDENEERSTNVNKFCKKTEPGPEGRLMKPNANSTRARQKQPNTIRTAPIDVNRNSNPISKSKFFKISFQKDNQLGKARIRR